MNMVCYEHGLLWTWSVMNMVCYEHGLLWTWSVMNMVCYEWVCYERVCYERVCYERVCYERVCYERVCYEWFCFETSGLLWPGLFKTNTVHSKACCEKKKNGNRVWPLWKQLNLLHNRGFFSFLYNTKWSREQKQCCAHEVLKWIW